jgi:hypothetical protein
MRDHQRPTTIAIIGADALAEGILVRLLEREGYPTRILEAHPATVAEGLLDGVDLLLLTPGMSPDVRAAFLGAMRSNPGTAVVPVLPLSAALKVALLDELSAGVSWRSLFEELVGQIGTALASAAVSARALLVDDCGEPATEAGAP